MSIKKLRVPDPKQPTRLTTGRSYHIRFERPRDDWAEVCVLGIDGKTRLRDVQVECHSHSGTRFAGKTASNGRIRFDGLEPGAVAVNLGELLVHPLTGAAPAGGVQPIAVHDREFADVDPSHRVRGRTGTLINVQAARVPVVFLPGLLGTELYLKHDELNLEIWPNLGRLAASSDSNPSFIQPFEPGDQHLYLLALAEHAYHPDGKGREFLESAQRKALKAVYKDTDSGSPSQAGFRVEVGDIVQDLSRTFHWSIRWLIDRLAGKTLRNTTYTPMFEMLTGTLGYRLYRQPNASEPVMASQRKPPRRKGVNPEDLFYFPYDWRQDPRTLAASLHDFVESVKVYTGRPKVHLVGHSYGALVSRCYAASHADSIERMVLGAGPHLGSAETLGALLAGHRANNVMDYIFYDEALRVLTCTVPGAYAALPRWKRGDGSQLRIQDGRQLRQAHGPAEAGKVNDSLRGLVIESSAAAGHAHVRPNPTLWQAADRLFEDVLGANKPPKDKTVLLYIDNPDETNRALHFELNRAKSELSADDDDIVKTRGDGTVPTFSAQPWQADDLARLHKVTSPGIDHGSLFNNEEVMGVLREVLIGQPSARGGGSSGGGGATGEW